MSTTNTLQRNLPVAFKFVICTLLCVTVMLLCSLWLMHSQLQKATIEQADSLGHSIINQTAHSVTTSLVANDTLSLNVLLNQLTKDPLIQHAAVYSIDNQKILAESGRRIAQRGNQTQGLYSLPITYQQEIAGHLYIQLNIAQLQKPFKLTQNSLFIISSIILILSFMLSLNIARSITGPLSKLAKWTKDPQSEPPLTLRADALGQIARYLREGYLARNPILPPKPLALNTPTELALTIKPSAPVNKRCYVLALSLGGTEQFKRLLDDELATLLGEYRAILQNTAKNFKAKLVMLNDNSCLLLFDDQAAKPAARAICCGEWLRAYAHKQQEQLIKEHLQLSLRMSLTFDYNLMAQSQGELLLQKKVQRALQLNQESCNLLLLNQQDVTEDPAFNQCALLRPVVQPQATLCVDQVLPPYVQQLEKYLARHL